MYNHRYKDNTLQFRGWCDFVTFPCFLRWLEGCLAGFVDIIVNSVKVFAELNNSNIGLLWWHIHIELRFIEVKVKVEWSWDEVELKFSWKLVEVELNWGWDKLMLNKGRNWAFIGLGLWFKICFKSTDIAEQHIFLCLLQFLL